MEGLLPSSHQLVKQRLSPQKPQSTTHLVSKQNQVSTVILYGIPIVSLVIESQERLCLAQISNTLLKQFSYNEIHNRRVALGITCVQCTPVQLEILRRAGAMPVSSRRCGMITRREAERLCKSFLGDNAPPRLPDDFAFSVHHECAWGCRGAFLPSRYNSSRAKCIKCTFCGLFFSPNKFIFHSHRTSPNAAYVQPDAANFNSWRRHMKLSGNPPETIIFAWEDVKAMFNGGTRKRMMSSSGHSSQPSQSTESSKPLPLSSSPPSKQIKLDSPPATPLPYPPPTPTPRPVPHRVPPFAELPLPISMMDYVWNGMEGVKPPFISPYLPWFGSAKRSILGFSNIPPIGPPQESILHHIPPLPHPGKLYHQSAFRPVYPTVGNVDLENVKKQPNLDLRKKPCRISPKRLDKQGHEPSSCDDIDKCDMEDDAATDKTSESYLKKEVSEDSVDSIDSVIRDGDVPRNYKIRERLGQTDQDYYHEGIVKERLLLERMCGRGVPKVLWNRMEEHAEDYSTKKKFAEGEDDEVDGRQSVTEEDETVDIETTDDFPQPDSSTRFPSPPEAEDRQDEQDRGKDGSLRTFVSSERKLCSPVSSNKQRIWTIARFSLEEPNRYPYNSSPHGSRTEECYNDQHRIVSKEITNEVNPESPKVDYRTSCTSALT